MNGKIGILDFFKQRKPLVEIEYEKTRDANEQLARELKREKKRTKKLSRRLAALEAPENSRRATSIGSIEDIPVSDHADDPERGRLASVLEELRDIVASGKTPTRQRILARHRQDRRIAQTVLPDSAPGENISDT